MAEGDLHKFLKKQALFFLKDKVIDLVANEVKFRNAKCVADAVGINLKRKEVRIVEVKATRSDFLRDYKLFQDNTSYFYHATYAYILCPKDLIQADEVPFGYGLLWNDEHDGITVIRKPLKNKSPLKTQFQTTLKRTVRRLTNELLYA